MYQTSLLTATRERSSQVAISTISMYKFLLHNESWS